MLQRLLDHTRGWGLDSERIVIGLSGGPDSTCLLHLAREAGWDVVAAHLDHGLRPDSRAVADRCRAVAEQLEVPYLEGRADIARLAKDTGVGVEEAGRNARYAFFAQAIHQSGSALAATAHTRDDHIETVLFRIARGTGLSGLAGIPERRERIVRPLLTFDRSETLAYCQANDLEYDDDPTNRDLDASRARIRSRVVPELEAAHPGLRSAIVRLSEIADEEDRFLDGAAAASLEQVERPLNGDLGFLTQDCEVAFDLDGFRSIPRVLGLRGLRLAFKVLDSDLDRDAAIGLAEALNRPKGSWTGEAGRVVAEWEDDRLHIRSLAPDTPFREKLTYPGETFADAFGWKLTVHATDPSDRVRPVGSLDVAIDPAALKGELYFRTAEARDAMVPLGSNSPKPLKELFQARKLTEAARARLPIVCDMVGPVWVPGCEIAARVKLTDRSTSALRLELAAWTGDGTPNPGLP